MNRSSEGANEWNVVGKEKIFGRWKGPDRIGFDQVEIG